ncbi:MAG: GNAT family N-acetyltransferase [Thermoplasmata archaeon]
MIVRDEVLALYDAEMRKDPVPEAESRVEKLGSIVRVIGKESYVIFSELNQSTAPTAIAEQRDYFRQAGLEVEWKVFGHDRPENLSELLEAAGFVPDEPETLVVFDLQQGFPQADPPAGVEIRRVLDESGVRDAVAANEAAFAPVHHSSQHLIEAFQDPSQALFVAYADGVPVSSGRVAMTPGRSFAGLWGGGTAPAYRHRGIYRNLVWARADLAHRRGARYLTVDARETSRPILLQLGFVPLTTTRAWVLRPDSP